MIRTANTDDATGIFEIDASVRVTDLANSSAVAHGFLISDFSADDYKQMISNSVTLVFEEDSKLLGFVMGWEQDSPQMAETCDVLAEVQWQGQNILELDKLMYVGQIGVLPEAARRGIGTKLHRALFDKCPERNFYTSIVEAPVRNNASISFFQKLGFVRVGSWSTDEEYYGLQDYAEGWYLRMN